MPCPLPLPVPRKKVLCRACARLPCTEPQPVLLPSRLLPAMLPSHAAGGGGVMRAGEASSAVFAHMLPVLIHVEAARVPARLQQ